jgi:hypothetical protein
LIGDGKQLPDAFLAAVARRTAVETDAAVRCQIISTARRLPSAQAVTLAAALLRRDVDGDDPFIPLLCWWTIEQCCDTQRTLCSRLPGCGKVGTASEAVPATGSSGLSSGMMKDTFCRG